MNSTNIETQALAELKALANAKLQTTKEADLIRKREEHLLEVLETNYKNNDYDKLKNIVTVLYRYVKKQPNFADILPNEQQSETQRETAFKKLWGAIKNSALLSNKDAGVFPNERSIKDFLLTEKKIINKTKNFLAICYGNAVDFEDYCQKVKNSAEGIEGRWISVVRSNDGLYLLFSNLVVEQTGEQTYKANLDNKFEGEGRVIGSYFQCILQNECKILLLSFFLGANKQPKLLKGTFSTVATNGSPVAGIELLVRPALLPKLVAPCKFDLKDSKIWEKTEPCLQKVFEDFDKCYFKIDSNKVYFEWADL